MKARSALISLTCKAVQEACDCQATLGGLRMLGGLHEGAVCLDLADLRKQ